MPADDESAHPTRQRVEAVGVEVLQALAPSTPRRRLLGRVPAPLVPAPVGLPSQAQGDAEPETGAHTELKVGEASSGGGGGSQEPSPSPGPSAPPQPGPRGRAQGAKEASSSCLSAPPGKVALPLGKSRGVFLPAPRLRRRNPRHLASLVQVHALSG